MRIFLLKYSISKKISLPTAVFMFYLIKLKIFYLLSFILLLITLQSCDILDFDDKYEPPGIDPIGGMPSPYQDVSVSANGQKLIFYRTKYTYVSKDGYNIQYDPDSTGIWTCNVDGSDLKLIYKNDKDYIGRPQFIPNSTYILFNLNTQIVKAPYNGRLIEDNEIIFLTSEGNNFFPSVSGDGGLIAFDSNNESPNGMYFIWTMNVNGSNKKRIIYKPEEGEIRMPSFYPSMYFIVHVRAILEATGGPEIFIMDKNGNNHKRLTFNNNWDEEPRINFNDNKILFISDGSLVITDTTGFNTKFLIQKSVQSATWSTENKIIFVWLFGYSQNNGTIWIMNEDGSNKKQITHNYGLVLEGGD